MQITMDITDGCNLSCPSCWRGSSGNPKTGITFLDFESARKALDHITVTFNQVTDLIAYNWGEPLLCKNIAEYVKLFSSYPNIGLHMSSNLNIDIDKSLIKSILPYIQSFRFSVSGYTQSVYEKYHKQGNIKKVLNNIELFAQMREETGGGEFHLAFGKNLYNDCDAELLREFCIKTKVNFKPIRYYLTDARDVYSVYLGEMVPKSRWELFYHTYDELRDDILKRLTPYKCPLLENDIVLDTEGRVMTCCASQISTNIHVWDIFDKDALNAARLSNPFCQKCYATGISGYFFSEI